MRDVDEEQFEFVEKTPINKRRKVWKKHHLSISEKLEIIHDAYVKMEKLGNIALKYRITIPSVSKLMRKARDDSKYMEKMINRCDIKMKQKESIIETIRELNKKNGFIDSVGSLVEQLRENSNEIV